MLHLDWDTLSSEESANFLQNRANDFLSTVPDLVLQTIKEKLTSGDTTESDTTAHPTPDTFKPAENLLDLAKHPLKFLRISPISNVRLSHLSLGSRAPVIQIRGLAQATPDVIDTFFRVLETSPSNDLHTASNPSVPSSMVVTPVPVALSLPVAVATKILKFAKALSRPRYIISPSDTDLNPVQDSGGFGYTSPSPRPNFDRHGGADAAPSRAGNASAPCDSAGTRVSTRTASALQASLASTPHKTKVFAVPDPSPRRGRHSPTSRDTLRTPAPKSCAPNPTAPARSPQPTPVTGGLSGVDTLLTLELALDSDLDAHVQADLQVANPFAEWASVQIDHSHCKHAQVRDQAQRLAAVLRGRGLGDAVARIEAAVPGSDAPDVAVVPPAPAATLPLGVRVRGVKVAAQVHVMVLATNDAKARARALLRERSNDDASANGASAMPGKLARKQQALAQLIPDVYVCVTAPALDPFASVAAPQDRSELSYALAHVPLDDSYAASVGLSSLAADEHAELAGFSRAQGPSTVVLNDLDVSLEFGAVSTLLKPLEAFLVGRIRTEVERAIAGRVVRLKLDVALEQPTADEGKDDGADSDHDSDDTDEDKDARAKYLHRYSAFLDPAGSAARDFAIPGKGHDFGNTFDSRLFTPGTFRRRSALDDSHLGTTRMTADVDRRRLVSAVHAPTPRVRARSASPDKLKKQENEYADSPTRGLSAHAAAETAAAAEATLAVSVEESASVAPSRSGHMLSSAQVRERMQRMQRYNASLPKLLSAQHNTQHPARSRSPVFDDAVSVSSMGSFRSLVSAGGLSEIGTYLGSRNFPLSAQFRTLSPATRSTSSFHTAISPSTTPDAHDLTQHPPVATPSSTSVPVLTALLPTPHHVLRSSAAPTPLLAPARTPSLSHAHTPSFTHMRARTPSRPSSAASSRIFTAVSFASAPAAAPTQPPQTSTPSTAPATPATKPLHRPASADPPPTPAASAPALAPPPALSSAASECLLLSPLNPHQRAILAAAGEQARFHATTTAPHNSLSTPTLVFAATDALVELGATAPARAGSESMCSDAPTQNTTAVVSLRLGDGTTSPAIAPSAPTPPSPAVSAASSMPGLEPLAHAHPLTHTQSTPVSTVTHNMSLPAGASLASSGNSSVPVAPEQESDGAGDGDNESLDGVLRDLLLARGGAHPVAASVAASSIPSNVYAALGKMMRADDTDNDTDVGVDMDAGRSFDPEDVPPSPSSSRASHSTAPSPLLRPHARAEPASAVSNTYTQSPLHAAEPRTPRRGSGAGREPSDALSSVRKHRAVGKYNTINFGTPSRNKTPGKLTPSRFSQFPCGDASEGELDTSSALPPLLSPYPAAYSGERPVAAALAQPVFTITDTDADADSASIAPSDAPIAGTAASASLDEAPQLGLGLGDLETSFRLPFLVAPTPRKVPAPRTTTAVTTPASGVRATPPVRPTTSLAAAQTTPRGTPGPLLFTHTAPADSASALPMHATSIPPALAALASPRRATATAPAVVTDRSLSRSGAAQLPFSPFALSRTHTPIPAPTPSMRVSHPPLSTPLVDGRSLSFIATPTSAAPAPAPEPTSTPASKPMDASARGNRTPGRSYTRPSPTQPVVFSASPLPSRAPTQPTSPTSPRGPSRALPVSRSLSSDALGDGPQRDISPQRITKATDLLFYKYRAPATEAPAALPRRSVHASPSTADSGFAQDISRITFSGEASSELTAQELSGSFLNNTTLSLNTFAGMTSPTRTYGARPLPLAQTLAPRPAIALRSNATPSLAASTGRPTLSFLASPPPATPPSADAPAANLPPSPALSTALSTATAVIPLPLPPFIWKA